MFRTESFGDMDEALRVIRERSALMQEGAAPFQRAITWGDHFMLPAARNMGLRCWGRIWLRDELEREERGLGAPDEEIAVTLARLDDAYERGFRFARTYSAIEPDGELGTVHVCRMIPVTTAEFLAAAKRGWA